MQLDPHQLERKERYRLTIGAIVPRPIAFVSTANKEGTTNLAPFSFFSGVSSNPMTVLFCPANNPDGTDKDTLRNIEETGEFVINVVSIGFARQMAACSEGLDYGDSEFALTGLTPIPCTKVSAPRVKESKVSFECTKQQIIRLNPGAVAGGNIVIGEVVWIHVDDSILDDRKRIDPAKLRAVGRMGGLGYCTTGEYFEIPSGKAALEKKP